MRFYNKDIVTIPEYPATVDFYGLDSKLNYDFNLKKMGQNWEYASKKVNYSLNKDRFRNDFEFDEVSWNDAIVVFGCSQVFGLGLAHEDLMTTHLERLTGKRVVNMGIGGASNSLTIDNMAVLSSAGHEPYAVINFWSSMSRFSYYLGDNKVCHAGPWVCSGWPVLPEQLNQLTMKIYDSLDETHFIEKTLSEHNIVKSIWKNTFYYEGSFFPDVASLLGVYYFEYADYSRDLGHIGSETSKVVAEHIYDSLN